MARPGNNHAKAGKVPTTMATRSEIMAAYDELPPQVRKVLQDAPFNSSTAELAGAVEMHGADTVARLVKDHLRKAFRKQFKADIGEAYIDATD